MQGSGVEAFMCQPGLVQSNLTTTKLDKSKVIANLMEVSSRVYGQNVERGSLCLQRAATDPLLKGDFLCTAAIDLIESVANLPDRMDSRCCLSTNL